MITRGTIGNCKDCGEEFRLAESARRMDVARGLSEPERCPDCRKRRRREIKARGAIFQEPPKETDDSRRCWGKFGLAQIVRKSLDRIPIPDNSVPVDVPLRWLNDPQSVDQKDRLIAEKFARIAPAAEALVRNLENPNGTRFSILIGPTGTGKSTWVPYRILQSKIGEQGRICITQPRLVTLKKPQSAKSKGLENDTTIPGFVARELLRSSGVGAGHEVGYQYSGEYEEKDRYTKLLFVTDGTLINRLKDGSIGQFDIVFVDEAHEQSANMEQIFALLKYRLSLYPRMRVVIASATADVEKFRRYFGDGNPDSVFLTAPHESANTTPHTIHDRRLNEWASHCAEMGDIEKIINPQDLNKRLPDIVPKLVNAIRTKPGFTQLDEPQGDILVFVPTVGSTRQVAEAIRKSSDNAVAGLGRLDVVVSHAQQDESESKAFLKSERSAQAAAKRGVATTPQRVIVATNYAETSVTLANVRYVIDSGLILQPDWKPDTCSYRYETKWHSKAGCTQRKGRVGRTNSGEYFQLYSSTAYETFPDQTPPELTRQPLDEFLLSAKSAGIEHLDSFHWMSHSTDSNDSTKAGEFQRSLKALTKCRTLDVDGDITDRGLELGALRIPLVELAECLALADRFACAFEVATFLACASQSHSPFARDASGLLQYARWRSGCYDDIEFYLRLIVHWYKNPEEERKKWAERESLRPEFFQSVLEQHSRHLNSLDRHDEKKQGRFLDLRRLNRVRLIFARCLSEWTYVAEEGNLQTYRPFSNECPSQAPVRIDPDSACVANPGMRAFVCLQRVSRGDKLFARQIVQVDPRWLLGLQDIGPIGMSLLLRSHLDREYRAQAERTATTIRSVPSHTSHEQFQTGHLLDNLRVIRRTWDDKRRRFIVLAEDVDTGRAIIASEGNSELEIGVTFRAVVEDAAFAAQAGLLQHYADIIAQDFSAPIVAQRYAKDSREIYALWLQLEPGVKGELRKADMPVTNWGLLREDTVGQRLEVAVKGVTEKGKIELESSEVRRGRNKAVSDGNCFTGVVKSIKTNTGGDVVGFLVECFPGRDGYLPIRHIEATAPINDWCPEQKLDVTIIDANASPRVTLMTKAVASARRHKYKVGELFIGTVVRFHMAGGQRHGAIVEFQPGMRGFLPVRHFPSEDHGVQLHAGKRIDVAIAMLLPDGKFGLRWLPPMVLGGSVSVPIVEVSRHSTTAPIVVMLSPWIRAVLQPGTARFRKLRASAGIGQRIRVKVRKVVRNENDRQISIELNRMSKHGERTDTIFAPPVLVVRRQKEAEKEAAEKTRKRQKNAAAVAREQSSIKIYSLIGLLQHSGTKLSSRLSQLRELGFNVGAIESWKPSKSDQKRLQTINKCVTLMTSGTSLIGKREASKEYNSAFDLTAEHYRQLRLVTDRFLLDHGRDPRTGNHVPPHEQTGARQFFAKSTNSSTARQANISNAWLWLLAIVVVCIAVFSLRPNQRAYSPFAMVLIPAGQYQMGSPAAERHRSQDEGPQHSVDISQSFYIGVYEVTQSEFESLMGANPSAFSKTGRSGSKVQKLNTSTFPVETVSWFDAVEFCNKLSARHGYPPYYSMSYAERDKGSITWAKVSRTGSNGYRLPTEAEWEYACRAGTTTPNCYGTTLNCKMANVNDRDSYGTGSLLSGRELGRTTTVGSYQPNALGLFDMYGNVEEWCWDWYDEKVYSQCLNTIAIDPTGPISERNRVARGGSASVDAEYVRSANRNSYSPEKRVNCIGFRLARSSSAEVTTNAVFNSGSMNASTPLQKTINAPIQPSSDRSAQSSSNKPDTTISIVANSSTPLPETINVPVKLNSNRPAQIDSAKSDNAIVIEMKLIPAGKFTFGSSGEGPSYPGEISRPFYIGVYEVTQEQYELVMGINPSYFSKSGDGSSDVIAMDTSRFPVDSVSWLDAVEFCNRLSVQESLSACYRLTNNPVGVEVLNGDGYRLPTEEQWEFACRAYSHYAFNTETRVSGKEANINGKYVYLSPGEKSALDPPGDKVDPNGIYLERTTRVGSYRPNAFGLFDAHGNVQEWCSDCYDARCEYRVLRGGSWYHHPKYARSATRKSNGPTSRLKFNGFRIARDR